MSTDQGDTDIFLRLRQEELEWSSRMEWSNMTSRYPRHIPDKGSKKHKRKKEKKKTAMAPIKNKKKMSSYVVNLLTYTNLKELVENILFKQNYFKIICGLLLLAEILVNFVVIYKVPYTEIDWKAYMSEVEGFLNGTFDYTKLEGATGPLVYPAGFVYLFSILYYLTSHGTNIWFAQHIFVILYLINLVAVFHIYQKTKKVPPYVMFFVCCTSYRIHSIFILRLFNDPVAMIFLYLATICFMNRKWLIGCIVYSVAVSIKMNILLFAPGLFIILLNVIGAIRTFKHIMVCAIVQLALGLPFLLDNPIGYIERSFNLGRQFFFIWTVNWRFLPEWLFLSRPFHVSLLAAHIIVLLIFILKRWPQPNTGWFNWVQKFNLNKPIDPEMPSHKMVEILFVSNFIGMCFARSLHYQFYVWYFHTLPYLLWNMKGFAAFKLLILGLIELCWNTYPSTSLSSAVLHICHAIMLIGNLLFPSEKEIHQTAKDE